MGKLNQLMKIKKKLFLVKEIAVLYGEKQGGSTVGQTPSMTRTLISSNRVTKMIKIR